MMILSRTPSARIDYLRLLLAAWIVASQPVMLIAQVSPEEHASHHPGQAGAGAERWSRPCASPSARHRGRRDGRHDGRHDEVHPQPKELYPRLMDLPELPMEERAQIEHQAHRRMMDGTKLLSAGLDELAIAAATDDFPTMQAATAKMREGLAQFESGLAAHRAIREGKAPRSVALQWFKREMNLLPLASSQSDFRLWGMDVFHTVTMTVLVIFAVVMIWIYFFKMRRATALLQRLAAEPASGAGTAKVFSTSPPSKSSTDSTLRATSKVADQKAAATAGNCCDNSEETCPSDEEATDRPDISTGLLPIRKEKLCRMRVARIDQETPDVKTFRLVACHGGGIPFNYLPGLLLTLTLPVGGEQKPRVRAEQAPMWPRGYLRDWWNGGLYQVGEVEAVTAG